MKVYLLEENNHDTSIEIDMPFPPRIGDIIRHEWRDTAKFLKIAYVSHTVKNDQYMRTICIFNFMPEATND